MDDPRIREIRRLLQEATKLHEATTQLIAELTDQLQRSIFTHDDRASNRGSLPERRGKPRP